MLLGLDFYFVFVFLFFNSCSQIDKVLNYILMLCVYRTILD